eukprot:12388202-Alexandrium_andersonii.AAC.1
MSASLVGSEMCIRDRLSCAHSGGPAALRTATDGARRCALEAPSGGSKDGCLLYTSDAADDM